MLFKTFLSTTTTDSKIIICLFFFILPSKNAFRKTFCVYNYRLTIQLHTHFNKSNSFSYAKMVGAKHFYTSAKLNQGVEELFLELTREMVERFEQNSQTEVNRTSRVLVVEDETPTQSSCCSGARSN